MSGGGIPQQAEAVKMDATSTTQVGRCSKGRGRFTTFEVINKTCVAATFCWWFFLFSKYDISIIDIL